METAMSLLLKYESSKLISEKYATISSSVLIKPKGNLVIAVHLFKVLLSHAPTIL